MTAATELDLGPHLGLEVDVVLVRNNGDDELTLDGRPVPPGATAVVPVADPALALAERAGLPVERNPHLGDRWPLCPPYPWAQPRTVAGA